MATADSVATDQTILQEGSVRVSYRFAGSAIQFRSQLPEGWSFMIAVDGDQNGVWGFGPGQPPLNFDRSPDFSIGQTSNNGTFCGQYIGSAFAEDPRKIYASTSCEVFLTGGYVQIGQIQADDSAMIAYSIPLETMFGRNDTLNIQVCIWDNKRLNCYFSPDQPYVIKRI